MDLKAFWNNYKYWIIGGILAVIILPKIFRFITGATTTPGDETDTGTGGTAFVCQSASADRQKPFGLGTTKSNEVCYLQTWLNMYKNAGLKKDGALGTKTQTAMVAAGLPVSVSMTLDSLKI